MDVRAQRASPRLELGFADVAELVDVYTRGLVSGALFVPLEKLDAWSPGQTCELRVRLPVGEQEFTLEASVDALEDGPPRGLALRLSPLGAELQSALEAYLTEVVRGDVPNTRLPASCASSPAPVAADAALAFQEEDTGLAAEGRPMHAQIRELTHQERIHLALSGGRAARAALIRNPQPAYHPYVVQNPRITRQELAEIAKNPNVAPEALRMIAGNAQHMSDPAIRFAVIKNPKTDPQVAQKFLVRLPQVQLRQLARSDDVRAPIRSGAVRLLSRAGR